MSAVLQIYKAPSCTVQDELLIAGDDYDLTLGPNTGLDGDTGDRADMVLYVKNTGDKPAMYVRVVKDNDQSDMVTFRTGSGEYTKNNLVVTDILPSEVVQLYVRTTVPKGTPASLVNPNITFKYKSLP